MASASQLGSMCVALVDVLKKIKGATVTIRRYQQQLQDLRTLSGYISANPLLQTSEIKTYTESLVRLIDKSQLNSLLRKGRVLRAWYFLQREQDLQDTFITLERQKSSLSLAIEHVQARALHQIQANICAMASEKRDAIANGSAEANFEPRQLNYTTDVPETAIKVVSKKSSVPPRQGPVTSLLTAVFPNTPHNDEAHDAIYNGCMASGAVSQRNGVTYIVDGVTVNKLPRSDARHLYDRCAKTGTGTQVNGPRVECIDGEVECDTIPTMNAEWRRIGFSDQDINRTEARNVGSETSEEKSIQYNGPQFVYKTRRGQRDQNRED